MYLFGHLQGFTTQRQIYDYFQNHWRAWFPALPAYQTFNQRLQNLSPAFELLITEMLQTKAWQIQPSDDRLIDSVPVMLARGTRSNRAKVAPELAATGFCASKQLFYSGVKLHFIAARRINSLPLPEKIHLSAAAQHDLAVLRELNPHLPTGSALFADKAYFCAEAKEYFKEQGWFLLASYKRRRNEAEKDVPTRLKSLYLGNAPATGKFVQLDNSENRFTERFKGAFKFRIESALLRKTSCCLFVTHFLLLIHIIYSSRRLHNIRNITVSAYRKQMLID